MKFAVMGAGALGCYFGGRMAEAGADISFVARGAHLKALQQDGLRIASALGDAHISPVHATDDPGEIGPVDAVMFLVKLYDTEAAAAQMAPMIGPDTMVVSFQNGIDAWERIGAVVGSERVIGGAAYIPADIREPGLVSHNGPFARLVFGEFDGGISDRCRALADAFAAAGIENETVTDIDVRLWEKFLFLSALSAITSLTRLPLGTILADEQSNRLFRAAIDETLSVGRAACPALQVDAAERSYQMALGLPKTMRASMLDDLERGKRMELEGLSGAVVRIGAKHGVPTPVHGMVCQALSPYVSGPPPATN